MSRLQLLLVVAVLLLGVACVSNYVYWRRVAARKPAQPAATSGPSEAARRELRNEIRSLEDQVRSTPGDNAARQRLAQRYFESNDFSHSLAELRLLETASPEDSQLLLREALIYRLTRRLPEAERAVRRALTLHPEDAENQYLLAEITLDEGRARDALLLFEKSLRARPNSSAALLGKGRALEELFRHHHPVSVEEMVRVTRKASELEPKQPRPLLVLARIEFAYLKHPQEAEQLAIRALALDPRPAGPYLLLAEITLSYPATPENLKRAGEYAYQAGVRNLSDPRPPAQVGRVYLAQNDPQRAIRALEHSLSLGPTPEAISQLSIAYRRAGNAERAAHYAAQYQRYNDLLEQRDALLRKVAHAPGAAGPCSNSPRSTWPRVSRVPRPAGSMPLAGRAAAILATLLRTRLQEQRAGPYTHAFSLPIP